jgi:DNA primase
MRDLAAEWGVEIVAGKSLCPIHSECNPSAQWYRDHLLCYGCGANLDALDFLVKVGGLGFVEALEYLAARLGLPLPWTPTSPPPRRRIQMNPLSGRTTAPQPEPPSIDREKCFTIWTDLCQAAAFREGETAENCAALGWLARRGIGADTARRARTGFIRNYEGCARWLLDRYSLPDLKGAALFNLRGNLRLYRHRLLWGFWSGGRCLGLQARALDADTHPKELLCGSPEVPFGIDGLLGQVGEVYLAEGVVDALSLAELGLPALGIPGVFGFKPAWVQLLANWQPVLAFDNDRAGKRGIERVARLFEQVGRGVRVLNLPEGVKDLNELLLRAA